jgi:hypothetical protein
MVAVESGRDLNPERQPLLGEAERHLCDGRSSQAAPAVDTRVRCRRLVPGASNRSATSALIRRLHC